MAKDNILAPELNVNDVNSFFSLEKNAKLSQVKVIPSGTYQGQCFNPNANKPDQHDETIFMEYYRPSKYEDIADENDACDSLITHDMQCLEIDSIPPLMESYLCKVPEKSADVYKNYDFTHKYDDSLPIFQHLSEIVHTVSMFPVTIIQGSTGSGKTTQVPQFILDDCAKSHKHCNIVVTQPRKIAAISIANRVAQERNWSVGHVVGYQVGLDKKTSPDTRITYVTTGVLLRHLIVAKSLKDYTHVILDEVHERDQETDFALLLVRKLLWLNSKFVKVILMSATFDTNELAKYFGSSVCEQLDGVPPTITVSGQLYTVTESYIENLQSLGNIPRFNAENPEISEEVYIIASKLIIHLDKLEKEEQLRGISLDNKAGKVFRGSVLVFLPGLFHIREMEEILNYERVSKQLQIIPLHSSITSDEQNLVFSKPKPGYRKVILSTNIAESSITVPDIKFVLDFCLTKCMVCDINTNYQSLQLQWASKASARQRAGRAGRVSSGRVYRLVPQLFWDNHIADYAVPEIQRCSLENAVLQVKLLDLGEPRAILSLALSPPDLENIERTILLLKEIGALSTTTNHKRLDGDLTFVGRVLATLPIDMRLGKLLMLGFVFGCFSNCLVIAAALSKPCFFATPYNNTLGAYRKKLMWSGGSFSDSICLLRAYRAWEKCTNTQQFRRKADQRKWGQENYIQIRRINEVHHLVDDLRHRLRIFNIYSDDQYYWSNQDSHENEFILKIVMAGAFYPNYFEQSTTNEISCVKAMSLLDPAKCVKFTGIPHGKGPLFKDSLLNATKQFGKQKAIYYDGCKVFIEFEDSDDITTGNVLPALYLATKSSRTRKHPLEIYQSFAEVTSNHGVKPRLSPFLYEPLERHDFNQDIPKPGEPIWFPVQVTHLISATSFWGTRWQQKNLDYLKTIAKSICNKSSEKVSLTNVTVGTLFLAPFNDGECVEYYRALITESKPAISVWFVDYGNVTHNMDPSLLRNLPSCLEQIPFQAIEFRLQGVRLIASRSPDESTSFLHRIMQSSNNEVQVKVYSVVSDVVHVDLFTKNNEYVNEILIHHNYCEATEESRVSQLSHTNWELAESEDCDDPVAFSVKFSEQWVKLPENARGSPISPGQGRKLGVNGPHTTFETSFASIVNIGLLRKVQIDRNSINCVSINQNPSNSSRVVMIASEIGISQSGSTMLTRNTTLLPDIKGLQSILCVLFAPVIEFRVDCNKTRYTGAICGLGAIRGNGRWYSMLPDHDIEVQFDIKFSAQDIVDINSLRMAINIAVGSGEDIARWGQSIIHKIQKTAREKLVSLLQKQRTSVDPVSSKHFYSWKVVAEHDLMPHQISDRRADRKDFYRLHNGVLLNEL